MLSFTKHTLKAICVRAASAEDRDEKHNLSLQGAHQLWVKCSSKEKVKVFCIYTVKENFLQVTKNRKQFWLTWSHKNNRERGGGAGWGWGWILAFNFGKEDTGSSRKLEKLYRYQIWEKKNWHSLRTFNNRSLWTLLLLWLCRHNSWSSSLFPKFQIIRRKKLLHCI